MTRTAPLCRHAAAPTCGWAAPSNLAQSGSWDRSSSSRMKCRDRQPLGRVCRFTLAQPSSGRNPRPLWIPKLDAIRMTIQSYLKISYLKSSNPERRGAGSDLQDRSTYARNGTESASNAFIVVETRSIISPPSSAERIIRAPATGERVARSSPRFTPSFSTCSSKNQRLMEKHKHGYGRAGSPAASTRTSLSLATARASSAGLCILLSGRHVICPASGLDGVMDVSVVNGRIAAVGRDLRGGRTPMSSMCAASWFCQVLSTHKPMSTSTFPDGPAWLRT